MKNTTFRHFQDQLKLLLNKGIQYRSMYVEVDIMKSSVRILTTYILQGSILGSLDFLTSINNISNSSNIFKFILFVDDTNLFSAVEYTFLVHTYSIIELSDTELSKIYK